ncbi:hypothetical protein [Clostridium sp. UBA4548]|uniref:hypothetical protein n=1 Tax=Clostridium sp. UBA4548 TaxID=1946361 RepID=UPI0025BC3330|nr:hypothetical protein [Clostridium sp. UBA4548]
MQTKVTFFAYTENNIPIGTPQILVINEDTKQNLGDNVAIFNEYSKIVVLFESTDPNALLKIDSSTSEVPLNINVDDKPVVLSETGDSDTMLTPGYYGVEVITSKGKYDGLYLIKPTSVSWDGLINLRSYLEDIMIGLSQNLYIQRMTGQKNMYGDNDYSLNKLYSYINNNIGLVINNIESIINNPLSDVAKRYREQHYSARQDMKSQKWLSSKGINKNRNPYVPEITFERHTFLEKDVSENRWVRKILNKSIEIICDSESKYMAILNEFSNKLDLKEAAFIEKSNKHNSIINDRRVSKEHKYVTQKELEYMKNELNKLKSNRVFIQDITTNLKKFKSLLLHYSNETWFNEIPDNIKTTRISHKMLKDYRYFQLYDFYNNIISVENNSMVNRKPYFPSKKSSKLFEYYAVVSAIQVLRQNGFEWISGWLSDNKSEDIFNGEIPSNEPMIFEKDNLLCELFYEKKVRQNMEVASSNTSDFVRMNARHYEPDIIIGLFDKETHELLKSAVVEVKCAFSRNLYSSNGPTRAIEQAKDYYSFGYYDKNKRGKNKTIRSVIDEIIIIYPKQEKKITYDYDDINLSFIQVEALDSQDITQHYGYMELKNAIESCLELI